MSHICRPSLRILRFPEPPAKNRFFQNLDDSLYASSCIVGSPQPCIGSDATAAADDLLHASSSSRAFFPGTQISAATQCTALPTPPLCSVGTSSLPTQAPDVDTNPRIRQPRHLAAASAEPLQTGSIGPCTDLSLLDGLGDAPALDIARVPIFFKRSPVCC